MRSQNIFLAREIQPVPKEIMAATRYRGNARRTVILSIDIRCEYNRTAQARVHRYRRRTTNIAEFRDQTENIAGGVTLKATLGEHLSGELATTWDNSFNDISISTEDTEVVEGDTIEFQENSIHYHRKMTTTVTVNGATFTVVEEHVDDAALPVYETAPLTQEELIARAANYMAHYHGVTDGRPLFSSTRNYDFDSDYENMVSESAIDALFVEEDSYWNEQRELYNEWARRWAFPHSK